MIVLHKDKRALITTKSNEQYTGTTCKCKNCNLDEGFFLKIQGEDEAFFTIENLKSIKYLDKKPKSHLPLWW